MFVWIGASTIIRSVASLRNCYETNFTWLRFGRPMLHKIKESSNNILNTIIMLCHWPIWYVIKISDGLKLKLVNMATAM